VERQPGQEPGLDCRNRTAGTGLRSTWRGKPEPVGEDMSAWAGRRGHEDQNMAAGTGKLGQDNWAGKPRQDSRDKIYGTGAWVKNGS
jgi:hypothetical protein